MSAVPQMSFLHTSFGVISLKHPHQHPSGRLTALSTRLHLSKDQHSFTNFQVTMDSETNFSKEALATLVCLGTVRELHPHSRVSSSCFVGRNLLVNDGSVAEATHISSYSYLCALIYHKGSEQAAFA